MDNNKVFAALNQLLGNTSLNDVTADQAQFSELKDGFYLSELKEASFQVSKNSGQPMVKLEFSIFEDGLDVSIDQKGRQTFIELKKTKGRKFWLYYVLQDEAAIKRFVSDMLKFEGDVEGESLLDKSMFTSVESIEEALEAIKGACIYVQVSTSENDDGSSSTWKNIISWKRAKALELPM